MTKLEFKKDRALGYISHLVLVRSMLKNCNFPSMSPDEEKIFQSIAIDCCLDLKISAFDLEFLLENMTKEILYQGIANLKLKGFIDFENSQYLVEKDQHIKLTKMANE